MATETSAPVVFPILKRGRRGSQKPPGIILFTSHTQNPWPRAVPMGRVGKEKSWRAHGGRFRASEMLMLMRMRQDPLVLGSGRPTLPRGTRLCPPTARMSFKAPRASSSALSLRHLH